jgi:hypothetical protein
VLDFDVDFVNTIQRYAMYDFTEVEGIVVLHTEWYGCGYRLRRLQMHPMAIHSDDPAGHIALRLT